MGKKIVSYVGVGTCPGNYSGKLSLAIACAKFQGKKHASKAISKRTWLHYALKVSADTVMVVYSYNVSMVRRKAMV